MKKIAIILFLYFGGVFLLTLSAQESDALNAEDVLGMSLADLMGVHVISASKTRQSIRDVAATVYVITSEQIKERAYFTLEEALSDLPGFQFRNIQGFNSYVFLRGAPSQNNLIILMIDGVQVNELNSGGFYAGGQFIMSDIEQIEVVYGPASSLYGTNAVSGIINIITKQPGGNSGRISILGGNFNTVMANFNVSGYNKAKDAGFSLSGQYKTTEKADLAGDEGDNNWTDDMENFEQDLSFAGRLKVKNFEGGIDYQEKISSMTTNYRSVDDIYLDRNTLWDIFFLNAHAKYSGEFNEKVSLKSTAYYRNSTVKPNTIDAVIKSTATTEGSQIGYYRPNHLVGLENQLEYEPNDRLFITGGVILEAEELAEGFSITYSDSQDAPPPSPAAPGMLNNYLFSYYLQLNYSLLEQLSFIGGVRHDFSDYYGKVFVPRVGMVFNQGNFTAKALCNSAYRSPKPWDYTYGTGNSDLKPERMKSLELNLSQRLGDGLTVSGSFYYNTITGKLVRETDFELDRWVNRDALNTTGFEIVGNYVKGDVDVYVNYTYNGSTDKNGLFVAEISANTANAGVSYTIGDAFNINLRANYLGNRTNPFVIPSTGDDKIDDVLILNGSVAYTGLKSFDLRLKVNNIFNTEYYHSSNRFAGRYRQPQRAFSVIATYNFRWKNL